MADAFVTSFVSKNVLTLAEDGVVEIEWPSEITFDEADAILSRFEFYHFKIIPYKQSSVQMYGVTLRMDKMVDHANPLTLLVWNRRNFFNKEIEAYIFEFIKNSHDELKALRLVEIPLSLGDYKLTSDPSGSVEIATWSMFVNAIRNLGLYLDRNRYVMAVPPRQQAPWEALYD